jgi:hypothetical protein
MELKYDWIALKYEWFHSEALSVSEFLRQKIGKTAEEDGNVARQTGGWTEAKKEWRERENRLIQDEMRKELIEKLKVKVEDVLAAKNLSYNLLISYIRCHAKVLKGETLTKNEEMFMRRIPIGNLDTINKWLNIELGLPVNISEMQGSADKPLNLITILDEARRIKEEDNNADKGGEA